MSQRVKIQYSIELDEIGSEVDRLFTKTMRELTQLGGSPNFDYLPLETSSLEHIDQIRRKLSRIDIMFGDIQNIISGYIQFKVAPPEEQVEPEPAEDFEIEDLERQLAQFKEMFNAQPDQESEETNQQLLHD